MLGSDEEVYLQPVVNVLCKAYVFNSAAKALSQKFGRGWNLPSVTAANIACH